MRSSPVRRPEEHFQIELFHEQLPLPVPCYDLVPVTELTLGPTYVDTSGTPGSLDLTGGEYKTWERIHHSLADLWLLAIPASWSRVSDSNPNWGRFWRLAQSRLVAARCNGHCIMCVAQGIRGTCWPGVILSFLPRLNKLFQKIFCKNLLRRGRSRVTLVTHNEGCVR